MSIFSDVLKLGVYEEQRKFWSTGSLSSETSEFYSFGPQRTIGDSKSRTSENTKYIYCTLYTVQYLQRFKENALEFRG